MNDPTEISYARQAPAELEIMSRTEWVIWVLEDGSDAPVLCRLWRDSYSGREEYRPLETIVLNPGKKIVRN